MGAFVHVNSARAHALFQYLLRSSVIWSSIFEYTRAAISKGSGLAAQMPLTSHVRFADSDDEAEPMEQLAPVPQLDCHEQPPASDAAASSSGMPLAPAATASLFWPAVSARTDYNTRDQCYVFDVVQCPGQGGLFAASCSNNLIKLYSLDQAGGGARLRHAGDLAGHASTITALEFVGSGDQQQPGEQQQQQHLASCSHDGTVRGWDCRAGAQVERCATCGAWVGPQQCSNQVDSGRQPGLDEQAASSILATRQQSLRSQRTSSCLPTASSTRTLPHCTHIHYTKNNHVQL